MIPGSTASQVPGGAWMFAVVDPVARRVIARHLIGGQALAVAIDAGRDRGYIVGGASEGETLGITAPGLELWTVAMSTGRLLSSRIFSEGGAATIPAIAVDPHTGTIAMLYNPTVAVGEVCIMLNPRTLWSRRIPIAFVRSQLEATPDPKQKKASSTGQS